MLEGCSVVDELTSSGIFVGCGRGPFDMNTITGSFCSSVGALGGAALVELIGGTGVVELTGGISVDGVGSFSGIARGFSVEGGASLGFVATRFPESASSADSEDDEDMEGCPSPPEACPFSPSSDKLPTMSADSAISAMGNTSRGSSDTDEPLFKVSFVVSLTGFRFSGGLSGLPLISCG